MQRRRRTIFLSWTVLRKLPEMTRSICTLVLLGAVVLGLLASPGCGGAEATKSGKIAIVCTVGMVADVVKHVAGDKAEVVTLMGAGIDPHGYKPTRDDVVRLQNADMVFYNGLLLEGKMTETLRKLGESKPVIAITDGVDRAKLLVPEGGHGEHDPHVWMDASLWAQTANVVATKLSERDPANASTYRANADDFAKRCTELYAYGKTTLAQIPTENRVLVTSHDAFSYFGRAYGIEVLGVQGISTESEANVRDINHLVDLLVTRNVKAVFVESSVPPKNLQAVIEGAKSRGKTITIGGELYSDAMGAAGTYEGTYLGMIDHNITTVARALGAPAPEKGWQGKLGSK